MRDEVEYDGQVLFNVGGKGKKEIEFYPLDKFDNVNNEYIVEMPLKKNSSSIN